MSYVCCSASIRRRISHEKKVRDRRVVVLGTGVGLDVHLVRTFGIHLILLQLSSTHVSTDTGRSQECHDAEDAQHTVTCMYCRWHISVIDPVVGVMENKTNLQEKSARAKNPFFFWPQPNPPEIERE